MTSILYVFKLLPLKADLTPIVLIFSGVLSAVGIYFQKMFDVGPIARIQTINNLTDGVIVVDMADRIVDVNHAFGRIINANRNELIGNPFKRFSNLFLDGGIDQINENEFLTETTIRTHTGLKYFEVKYSPVTNSRHQLIGRIFLLHDISIRKRALEAAFESNTLLRSEIIEKEKLIADLDAYARTVAHDLKNPISGVIGLTGFIKDDILNKKQDQAFEYLDLLHDQGNIMLKIVDELLLLSRIRKEDIKPESIDMVSIVKGAMYRLNRQAEDRKTTYVLPGSWPVVMGHSQWIEEVWVNLISNAIKYGGDPPRIKLGSEKLDNGWHRFWIQDNGDGVAAQLLGKLFADFERLGQKNVEGHGLGLSITKRIVEKLGGKVFVSSENTPGSGCIFSFTLRENTQQ
jgi:PAS domain S-box-containing protein